MGTLTNGYVVGGATDIYNKSMSDYWSTYQSYLAKQAEIDSWDTRSSSSTTSGGTTTVDPYDNQTANVTISMSDYDKNSASNVVVVGTSSDDVFENRSGGTHSTVFGGAGKDHITTHADRSMILGETEQSRYGFRRCRQ